MTALAKLPDLLHRIDALDSDAVLCRRRGCYAEAYRWLSPYCEPPCAPRVGMQGPTPEREDGGCDDREQVRDLIAATFDVPAELLVGESRSELERRIAQHAAEQVADPYGLRFHELLT